MRPIIITLVLILCGVGIFAACHGRQQNAGLPLVHASIPTANPEAVVIPWALNTRCRIDSRNLPPREERT